MKTINMYVEQNKKKKKKDIDIIKRQNGLEGTKKNMKKHEKTKINFLFGSCRLDAEHC